MAHLKRSLIAAGHRPDGLAADDEALAAIEKVLVGAGFDAVQVRDLLSELKTNTRCKGVKLSALFAGISRLEVSSSGSTAPNYLDISALPFLQTILADLGFSSNEVASLLNKAKVEGKGIDAGKLAEELRLMASGAGSGRSVSGDAALQGRIQDLLKQIGLPDTRGKNGVVDQESLAAALDKFADRKGIDRKKDTSLPDENPTVSEMIGVPMSLIERLGIRSEKIGEKLIHRNEKQGIIDPEQLHQALRDDETIGLHHLSATQRQKVSPDSESGRLSPARFAAVLERNADGIRPDLAGDWQTFVKNLHPAAPGARMNSASDAGLRLLQPEKAPASFFVSRTSLFAQEEAGKTLAGPKAFTANKAVNAAEFGAPKTDGPPIGAGEKTMMPIGDISATARAADRTGDVLHRSLKAAQKPEENSGTFLGDGGIRRPQLFNAAAKVSAQPATSKTLPFYVLNQVSRQILRSRLMNESEIHLQLAPPSLGRLKLTIAQTAAGLKVNIIAENTASKDMLLSNSGELKSALLEQGLRVDKIDVETQANFDQAMADARQDADRRFGHKRFAGGPRLSFDADPADSAFLTAAINAEGAVNLVA